MRIKSYFLASLAASFAFVACNKSDVEPNGAPSLEKTSVTLSLEDKSANSKTSITPNSDEDATLWSVEWQKDDMIGGWCADSYAPFVMESMTDGKTATFTGEAADKDALRFIYPYSATAVSGSTYTIDLGVQNTDTYYVASSNEMVMVSEPAADYFKTKTALIDVKFAPASYIPNTKVINFEISGDAISSTATLDLSAADAEFVGAGNGTIAATVTDDAVFTMGKSKSYSVAAVPFVLAPGESITVKVLMNTADVYEYPYAGNVKYTFTKTNNTSEDMVFGAGMRSTIVIDDLGEDSDNEPVKVEGFLGEGTEGNPYLISTRDDLLAINEMLTADLTNGLVPDETTMAEDNNCKGKFFRLTNNIDLEGQSTLLGKNVAGQEFRGTFDGAGYTISNNVQALFEAGIATDGVVKNLNIYIETTYASDKAGANEICALARRNRGLVQNCTSAGSITGWAYIGGLVAWNQGGMVVDCVNYATVTLGSQAGGGIVACNEFNSKIDTHIINCVNLGDVLGGATSDNIGGIVGGSAAWDATVHLVNCYNAGLVTGRPGSEGVLTGQIVGNNKPVNCYYSTESMSPDCGVYRVAAAHSIAQTHEVAEADMKKSEFVAQLSAGTYSDDKVAASGYVYSAWSNIEGFFATPLSGVAVAEAPAATPSPVDAWSTMASVNYGGGRGTETYPYMITSAAELAHFAASYDTDCYYRLAADINLAGYVWEPVTADVDYVLDMAGYTISNIYMDGSYENDSIFE